jgi:hypothetical protein
MGQFVRLQLIGRVTYYLGWIALACGGLVHYLSIARAPFIALGITQRNLFEIAVLCFLICTASELRALALKDQVPSEMSTVAKRQAVA